MVFVGGDPILPFCSDEGERPPHTKGRLTPFHCLFLVITSTTIESMGQGEARTLVRGGRLRNNKQMFFDDNCREGKRSVEGGLVKHSLVEAVPPASLPPLKPFGGMLFSPRSQSRHAGAITFTHQR